MSTKTNSQILTMSEISEIHNLCQKFDSMLYVEMEPRHTNYESVKLGSLLYTWLRNDGYVMDELIGHEFVKEINLNLNHD